MSTTASRYDERRIASILRRAVDGQRPDADEALRIAECVDTDALCGSAASIRDRAFGDTITWSRKVFVPLTRLCRDRCGYCTFAGAPRRGRNAYLSPEEVLEIAEAGRRAGCKEALFTLGERPETRYAAARHDLSRLGFDSTLDYVGAMAGRVFRQTGLLPHLNPGVMERSEFERLRPVALSMGLMLESAAERLGERGGPHHGCPDKRPKVRLAAIAAAGEARIPFTSGILLGIGETRRERIEALLALRELDDRFGHLQEIIVQNFRAKPGTRMAHAPEPSFDEHRWTIAVARILFGTRIRIQAPPNLAAGALAALLGAGVDDWGGVSPVTVDHVNPEAPWPGIDQLARETAQAGKVLVERLPAHPPWLADAERWIDPGLRTRVLQSSDSEGYARPGSWSPGRSLPAELERVHRPGVGRSASRSRLRDTIERAREGRDLAEDEIVALFRARGADFEDVCRAADALRSEACGDAVGYVITRNITYTNLCRYRCNFCAFSKGRISERLRGRPYELEVDEIAQRTREAWRRGATEVCIQGGIRPSYDAGHYLDIVRAAKRAVPQIHVHAFSPLEIRHGAAASRIPVSEFLVALREAGLGSLPGTAAEILDDDVRRIICPDKLSTAEWLDVVGTAHELGLRTTATIMFGHVDRIEHWARHLLHVRRLQQRTGGFTEFVPLPFVADETPIYLSGRARSGPTLREAVLMHAVARLALHPLLPNIQGSWVKLGEAGMRLVLRAGANDFGGTLMDESISRAAGASHGQDMPPGRIEAIITGLGRIPRQRSTLYGDAGRASHGCTVDRNGAAMPSVV